MAIDPTAAEMIRNVYFVSIHQISEAQYNKMIERFFGANPPAPKQYIAADYIADNQDPKLRILRLDPDFSKRNDNTEITAAFGDNPIRALNITPVYYSVPFLRGLNFIYDLTGDIRTGKIMHFSKALDDSNTNTVVVKIEDIPSGRVLYHGDLTNMIP